MFRVGQNVYLFEGKEERLGNGLFYIYVVCKRILLEEN